MLKTPRDRSALLFQLPIQPVRNPASKSVVKLGRKINNAIPGGSYTLQRFGVHFSSNLWSNVGKERLADASKETEQKKKRKEVVFEMQMLINVILSAILALLFLSLAIPFTLPTWINWVFGIAAALALILSFFPSGRK